MPTLPALLAAAALAAPAHALDRSADTLLVQPVLAPGGGVAVDTPRASDPWRPVAGLALQGERAPLTLLVDGEPRGPVVAWRTLLHLQASLAVSRATTVFVRGAVFWQDGQTPAGPAFETGLADPSVGLRAAWVDRDRIAVGPRLEAWIPVGRAQSWAAEEGFRAAPSLLLDALVGPVQVLASAGVIVRRRVDTGADFVLGTEAAPGLAVVAPARGRFRGLAEATAHLGFDAFLRRGAENPVEARAGVRLALPLLQADLVAGTGLDDGYGTADLRALLSVVWQAAPRRVRSDVEVEVEPFDDLEAEVGPAPVVVEVAPPRLLAEILRGRIVLRSPIAFEEGRSDLTPEAAQVVAAVADLLLDYGQIEQVAIEGHAWSEGPPPAAWRLSTERSETVWRALVDRGVRPERIAWRGLGDTAPDPPGPANRRVEFRITRLRDAGEVSTDPAAPLVVPWTGEERPPPPEGEALLDVAGSPLLEEVPEPPPSQDAVSPDTFREPDDQEEDP